ncbi:MAG: hypothetical protein EZS28_003565, partial [Streblomastix strix]
MRIIHVLKLVYNPSGILSRIEKVRNASCEYLVYSQTFGAINLSVAVQEALIFYESIPPCSLVDFIIYRTSGLPGKQIEEEKQGIDKDDDNTIEDENKNQQFDKEGENQARLYSLVERIKSRHRASVFIAYDGNQNILQDGNGDYSDIDEWKDLLDCDAIRFDNDFTTVSSKTVNRVLFPPIVKQLFEESNEENNLSHLNIVEECASRKYLDLNALWRGRLPQFNKEIGLVDDEDKFFTLHLNDVSIDQMQLEKIRLFFSKYDHIKLLSKIESDGINNKNEELSVDKLPQCALESPLLHLASAPFSLKLTQANKEQGNPLTIEELLQHNNMNIFLISFASILPQSDIQIDYTPINSKDNVINAFRRNLFILFIIQEDTDVFQDHLQLIIIPISEGAVLQAPVQSYKNINIENLKQEVSKLTQVLFQQNESDKALQQRSEAIINSAIKNTSNAYLEYNVNTNQDKKLQHNESVDIELLRTATTYAGGALLSSLPQNAFSYQNNTDNESIRPTTLQSPFSAIPREDVTVQTSTFYHNPHKTKYAIFNKSYFHDHLDDVLTEEEKEKYILQKGQENNKKSKSMMKDNEEKSKDKKKQKKEDDYNTQRCYFVRSFEDSNNKFTWKPVNDEIFTKSTSSESESEIDLIPVVRTETIQTPLFAPPPIMPIPVAHVSTGSFIVGHQQDKEQSLMEKDNEKDDYKNQIKSKKKNEVDSVDEDKKRSGLKINEKSGKEIIKKPNLINAKQVGSHMEIDIPSFDQNASIFFPDSLRDNSIS